MELPRLTEKTIIGNCMVCNQQIVWTPGRRLECFCETDTYDDGRVFKRYRHIKCPRLKEQMGEFSR